MDLLKIFQDCWGWCRGNNANQTLPSSPETTDEINNGGAEPESSLVVVTFEETGEEEEAELDLEVINQIKDFDIEDLNPQQESLIDKLIPDKKLKKQFKEYGLCPECQQVNSGKDWCRSCNSRRFQESFKNWTSGNSEVDKFIQKSQLEAVDANKVLEWIPYEKFKNIKFLAKGGYSTVYKADWNDKTVALKVLDNSQNIIKDDEDKFFQEIVRHKLFNNDYVVKCYGISHEPKTGNYVMVMEYIEGGNLRQYLLKNSQLSFVSRLNQLKNLALGLSSIHEEGLIHKDFHPGNVLNTFRSEYCTDSYVTDLGLSRPINEANDGKIYGVLPYVAPEVLIQKTYNQASDIYSFGIIAYEIFSNLPPYHEYARDKALVLRIREGLRPEFKIKIPSSLENLVKKCWDVNPLKRPAASEIYAALRSWCREIRDKKDTEFVRQYQEAEEANKMLEPNERRHSFYSSFYETYPQEFFTSRLLEFRGAEGAEFYQDVPVIVVEEATSEDNNISAVLTETIEEMDSEELISQVQVPPK